MNPEDKLPYSYHTFVYPFSFEEIDKLNIETNQADCKWIKEPFFKTNLKSNLMNATDEEVQEYRLQYNVYQYFFPKARQNIFNQENSDDISTLYSYKLNKEKSAYIIKRGDKQVELKMKALRANIFQRLQVGVLSFEMEYHPSIDESKESNYETALFINDYGRRLFPPYLTDDQKLATADEIQVVLTTNETEDSEPRTIIIDYKDKNRTFSDEPNLIRDLLSDSNEDGIVSSILDDRMFVVSLIRDDSISNSKVLKAAGIGTKEMKETGKEAKELIEEQVNHNKLAEKIYKFLFVDSDHCTCQNDEILQEKLRKNLYTRWLNYGTIHGITEYSMICITGTGNESLNSVINPFLMHYTEMAKLGLIQRASLVKLETEVGKVCSDISQNISDKKKKRELADNKILKEIESVWEDYILFQNQILLPEVTFQEQGVEIYQLIKQNLKIKEMNWYIDEELNNLHEMSNMKNNEIEKHASDKLNYSLNLLAVLGTIIALISMGQDYLGLKPGAITSNDQTPKWIQWLYQHKLFDSITFRYFIGFLSILVLIAVGYMIFKRISENNLKDKKWYHKCGIITFLFIIIIAFWLLVLTIPYFMAT